MADLLNKAPSSFTKGFVEGVFRNGVTMSFPGRHLDVGGTFSWSLRFDTVSGKLTTGGARPVDDESPRILRGDGRIDGDGAVDAYSLLEDADAVDVEAVGQSLCVILSGDPGTNGDGATPIAGCKRDAGRKILFAGDWRGATDDASCTDTVRVAAGFSASAVKGNQPRSSTRAAVGPVSAGATVTAHGAS